MPLRPALLIFAAFFISGLSPQTLSATLVIDWTATNDATVVDFDQVVASIGGIDFYALQNIDNGAGSATSISGSSSLMGVAPTDFTFQFGDLEQIAFSQGASGGPPSVQTYGEGDGSPNSINLFLNGQLLATGEYIDTVVTTDFDTGVATAVGTIQLLSAGPDPAFFNEVMSLTGGAGIILVETDTFIATSLQTDPNPDNWAATFSTTGRFIVTAVPEPASLWMCGLGLTGVVMTSRQRNRQTV